MSEWILQRKGGQPYDAGPTTADIMASVAPARHRATVKGAQIMFEWKVVEITPASIEARFGTAEATQERLNHLEQRGYEVFAVLPSSDGHNTMIVARRPKQVE